MYDKSWITFRIFNVIYILYKIGYCKKMFVMLVFENLYTKLGLYSFSNIIYEYSITSINIDLGMKVLKYV